MITLNSDLLLWAGSSSIVALTVLCLMAFNSLQPQTVACQALLTMEYSMQEHWSGSSFLPSGALPDPGIKPTPPALAARFCFVLFCFVLTSKPPGRPLAFYIYFYQGTYHYIL